MLRRFSKLSKISWEIKKLELEQNKILFQINRLKTHSRGYIHIYDISWEIKKLEIERNKLQEKIINLQDKENTHFKNLGLKIYIDERNPWN